MLRVENQVEWDASSGLSLALAVPRVDRRAVQDADQNRTHMPLAVRRYLKGACQ
jgi:hypothetical protein